MTGWTQVLASEPVTNWPARLALTLLLVAMVLVVLALMRRAWLRKGDRQADVAALPDVPPVVGDVSATAKRIGPVAARYLGATRAGDWLDRVVVHGLGTPSLAEVWVEGDRGVWILRPGSTDLFLTADDIIGVRHDRGVAGRVLERDGVLVITWRHGAVDLDLGLRVRAAEDAETLRSAVARLIADHRGVTPLRPTTTGDQT